MNYRRIRPVLLLTCVLLLALPVLADTAYPGPCPIGTNGAPLLINPHIASGALCRGACGQDCPPDRCELLRDANGNMQPLTVVIQNPRGVCTYNNVLECPMHSGCVKHDDCFDKCAEGGQNSITDQCHMRCNVDCVNEYGFTNCVRWADAPTVVYQNQAASYTGWIIDQASGVDFAGYLFFSDPPDFKPVTPTPTKSPTPTATTIRPTTLITSPPVTSLVTKQSTAAPTFVPSGSPAASGTEPPLDVQRANCAAAGGKWDYFSEGCIIPETPVPPTLGIPDLFKDKPTLQFTPDDFRKAAADAEKNGNHALAVTYIDAAENILLKASPDKSTRTADVDRQLAGLETAKATALLNMGKPDAANEAQNNARSLNADATSKESSWDLPGFEGAAGILALCALLLFRRGKN